MSRFEAWMLHASNLLVGGTGLVYAWMVYLVKPADPYAVVNHPFQPQTQHLHILVAPLLVFTAGLIWRRHVWSQFKRGIDDGRRSGLSLIFLLVPMVVSGYLIQTSVDDAWRRIWVAVHLVASCLWLLAYLAHQIPLLWRRRASSGRPGPSGSPPAAERPSRNP
ncbi:MAG: hypothetical protein ACJ75H_02405 [Thermoanaerobaculia bacterium]